MLGEALGQTSERVHVVDGGGDHRAVGLFMGAPHRHRRVTAEEVGRFSGNHPGPAAGVGAVGADQGQILPEQHPQFVGSLVELGSSDVTVNPYEVQSGLLRGVDVVGDQLG